MTAGARRLALGAALAALGCGGGGQLLGTIDGAPGAVPPGAVGGAVPAGLPAHLMIGLGADHGDPWMAASGVPWDVRYRFFAKGWADNFGFGQPDGSWGAAYLNECATQGYLPGMVYFHLAGDAGNDHTKTLATVQSPAIMAGYFADFTLLMQRVKEFGKPVIVIVEPTTFGYLHDQTHGDPAAPAAVASSGVAVVAGLPDTVAGFGLSFLQIRKAVGAANAILALSAEVWGDGSDVGYIDVAVPLRPHVDGLYGFLAPLGLAANATGATWDLLASGPQEHDANYDLLVRMSDRWFDASDAAPIASKSYDRYAAWLALLNRQARRRWLLWQVPVGNSNSLDVANTGAPREGYKDNHTEYFLGTEGAAHRALYARAGVVGILFSQGAAEQSSYKNDAYTDGALFVQSRAGAYLRAGGLALP
jgi:hypothetical protein